MSTCNLICHMWKSIFQIQQIGSQSSAPKCETEHTPVHLIESVENCGLCMRRCLAFSSYAQVMHCALGIMRALDYDASVKHWIMRNCKLPSLPLSCTGYNFYWLDEMNRGIACKQCAMFNSYTLRTHYAHAAANLNWRYSKYAKVARVHYFCTLLHSV